MPQLVIVEGPNMGMTYEVADTVVIGAASASDVVLGGIADRQATISRHDATFVFRNLDESRPVLVNGEPQRAVRIEHGDMISVAGMVMLFSTDEPTASDRADFEPKASQILTRQRLFRDAQGVVDRLGVNTSREANRRLVALYKISALLAEATDLEAMVARLLDVVFEQTGADRGYVILVDEDQTTVAQRFNYDRERGKLKEPPQVSRRLLADTIAERQGLITTRDPEDDALAEHSIAELGVTSTMLIPLLRQERLEGVLGVDSLRPERTFDDGDFELLTRVAVQAATGIATMRQLEEPARFSKYLRSLGRATQWLSSYLDRDDIIKETVSFAGSLFPARRASLMLLDEDRMLRVAFAFGLSRRKWAKAEHAPWEGVSGRVVATGEPLLVPDPETGQIPADLVLQPDRYATSSFLVVPIHASDGGVDGETRIIGVLCVTDKLDGRRFTRNDQQMMTILANQVGIALTNASLYEKATVDTLTRVHVRRYFFQRLAELSRKARQQEKPLSLLMFDLDRFKRLNDTYGHPAGDAVLRETGARVKSVVRHSDIACRYGGEEFAVILPDTPLEIAATIGERVRAAIGGETVPHQGVDHSVTVSVGIAQLLDGESREDLIERADSALYRAKETGRDRVCLADPGERSGEAAQTPTGALGG